MINRNWEGLYKDWIFTVKTEKGPSSIRFCDSEIRIRGIIERQFFWSKLMPGNMNTIEIGLSIKRLNLAQEDLKFERITWRRRRHRRNDRIKKVLRAEKSAVVSSKTEQLDKMILKHYHYWNICYSGIMLFGKCFDN